MNGLEEEGINVILLVFLILLNFIVFNLFYNGIIRRNIIVI